jgi:hypothetical protein
MGLQCTFLRDWYIILFLWHCNTPVKLESSNRNAQIIPGDERSVMRESRCHDQERIFGGMKDKIKTRLGFIMHKLHRDLRNGTLPWLACRRGRDQLRYGGPSRCCSLYIWSVLGIWSSWTAMRLLITWNHYIISSMGKDFKLGNMAHNLHFGHIHSFACSPRH